MIFLDTWITTLDGLRQAKDLVNQKISITVDNCQKQIDGFKNTNSQELYKIMTAEGYSIKVTNDTKFLVNYDGLEFSRRLNEIKIGDKVKISTSDFYANWNGIGTEETGYILGLLFGDGSINHTYSQPTGHLQFLKTTFALSKKCVEYWIKIILQPLAQVKV